jgi:hypothetical protein
MSVEFIGLPGVGKSTILSRMRSICKKENLNLKCDQNKVKPKCNLYMVLFFIRYFIGYPKSVVFIPTSFRWLIIKLAYRYCLFASSNSNTQRNLPNNTDGILMPIITYVVQRNPDNTSFNLSKVLDILPKPDVLIVVTANIETIVKRYSERGGLLSTDGLSRESVMVDSTLYNKFSSGSDVIEKIIDLMQKKGVKVLKVDNNQYLDNDKLKQIIQRIEND